MDELIKYTGNAPAIYTSKELAVIEAQTNSPKILSMSMADISRHCLDYISRAYIDAGYQLPAGESIMMLADSVADDLFTYFKTLSIKEAGLAIKNGIRGEYGEYVGISVKTLHNFFKSYKDSFDKQEVERKKAMNDEPEKKLSEQEANEIMKQSCINAFKAYKETQQLSDFGGAKFNYLKKLGVINMTKERYNEIFEQAKQQVLHESSETLHKQGNMTTAGVIATAVIKQIDTHEITKNVARLIALREYFDFLIENEFELTEMMNQ